MSNTTSAGQPAPPPTTSLKKQAVGVPGIVFFVVAAAGPLAATLGASPVAFGSIGVGAPATFAIAAVVLLVFSVGYAAMSRHVTSSAGFAAFLERAFGRHAGFGTAAVAVLSYSCMLLGLYGLFGYLTNAVVLDLLGVDVDWRICAALACAAVALLGYLEINLSAKVLGVLMLGEIAVLVMFDIVVLVTGGADGVNLDSFQPSNVTVSGMGVALLFAASCFVGFEATAIYGEEAKDPERTVPRATYVAVLIIGVFYTISTWCVALAWGSAEIHQAAIDDPAGLVLAVNSRLVGEWSTTLMNILLVTSIFAVLLAFHNALARYQYALGRAGMLPRALGRTHGRHQSPHIASVTGSVLTLVVVGIFAVAGADPYANLYAWLVGVGTVGVLVLQAATSIAVLVFFVTKRRADLRVWNCVVAPVLGAAGLVAAIVLALQNWDLLTGATSGLVVYLPWLVPLAAVVGLVWSTVRGDRAQPLASAFADDSTNESRAIISGVVPATPKD